MSNFPGYHPLRSVCMGWTERMTCARRAKQGFQDIADECMQFFSGTCDFMWKPDYKFKFWNDASAMQPRFKMTVAKAFELVALFGPALYHQNPVRTVTPRQHLDVPDDIFAMAMLPPGMPPPMVPDPMSGQMVMHPQIGMMIQQAKQQLQQQQMEDNVVAQLVERYLNYTPNEISGGGLQAQSELAITEALIKGRGCLWSEIEHMPGSDMPLIGSFFDSVDNLLIDPDAETVDTARWIAKRCVHPYWEVEDLYGLPRGTLKSCATYESLEREAAASTDKLDRNKRQNRTCDLMVYYKVWSRMGVGCRIQGVDQTFADELEQTFGDYVFLAIAPEVPFPLNLPTEALLGQDDQMLAQAAQWPIPAWQDRRWPVALLDFYCAPRSVWPIAPLAPGLGELKFINVMMSHLANRIWSSCRDLIVVAKSAAEDIKKWIEYGPDQTIIQVEDLSRSLDQVIQVVQQPQTNLDVWKILSDVMELFERRTGLTELMYGVTGVQLRSAEEASIKRDQVGVRPAAMARKVEAWATETARLEAIASRYFVTSQHYGRLFGPVAGTLWQRYVEQADPERVVREMEYRIEAGSTQRPNRDKDIANINSGIQTFGQMLNEHAAVTMDTRPLNTLIQEWGKRVEMNVDGLLMGPRQPPMPPPGMMPPEEEAPPKEGPSQ